MYHSRSRSLAGGLLLSASIAYLLVWLTNVIAVAIINAYAFDGPPADGPFQIFNPLRRLQAGQLPGRDFQFFHGIGIPLLHYPLFALFGGDLTGSELSRQLVTPLMLLLVLFIGWRWISGRWSHALVLAAFSVALFDTLPFSDFVYVYGMAFGARTAFPLLACAAFGLRLPPRWTGFIVGAFAALSLLTGTEQGTALIVAIILIALAELVAGRSGDTRQLFFSIAVGLVVTFPLLLLLVTRGSIAAARTLLRFNFGELGEDQFWYFGSDPAPFLSHWSQLLHAPHPLIPPAVLLPLIVWIAWLRWQQRGTAADPRRTFLLDAGLILGIYGLISLTSLLGIYAPRNTKVCLRSALLLAMALAYLGLWLRPESPVPSRPRRRLRPALTGAVLLSFAVALSVRTKYEPLHAAVRTTFHNVRDAAIAFHQGRTISKPWREELQRFHDLLGDKQKPVIWSTYAGLPESAYGVFNPDTDYIIHVLGLERRARYLKMFERTRADVVQTERNTPYFGYEAWIQSTSWPFYEDLIRRYVPVSETFHSLLWRPRHPDEPAVEFGPPMPLAVRPDNTIPLPPAAPTGATPPMAVVTLHYDTKAGFKWVPILGRTSRYFARIENALDVDRVALNPNTHEVSFPVHFKPGASPTIRLETEGLLPGASVQVQDAQLRLLTLPPAYALFARSALPQPAQ